MSRYTGKVPPCGAVSSYLAGDTHDELYTLALIALSVNKSVILPTFRCHGTAITGLD